MACRSQQKWQTQSLREFDRLEEAHRVIGGRGPGRRYATDHINQAYTVLLASHFQRFCRDLHSEIVDFLATEVADQTLRLMFRKQLTANRQLDRGNAQPASIGNDFSRFDLDFWAQVHQIDNRNKSRQEKLEKLNLWRNAIAHQDFNDSGLQGRTTPTLDAIRDWRSTCSALTQSFVDVLESHIRRLFNKQPW